MVLAPFTKGYKKISATLSDLKKPYQLFFAKAYQHRLFTKFLSLALAWLCFTTYPIILFSLYAKLQQQVISSAVAAVHATCVDLLAVILCKNYITQEFTNQFNRIAIQLSMRWTNEVDTENSVDTLVRKKKEQNNPRTNIATFCSSFIKLNQQLLQNLNKVSLAILFILHYCTASTFLGFLGCIMCIYMTLSHINHKIKKQKNKLSILENKANSFNEDSKHQQEAYVGNTHQNDNRCNVIKENHIEISETETTTSELEKWRDWIADSCENAITPFIIGFGLSGFRESNIGVGILFQIIQAFERCCNLFTQNGGLSTKLQSSFSVTEKLPTYWHDQDSCHRFHQRNSNETFVTTLYTANLAAITSLVLKTIHLAHVYSTQKLTTNIFFAIYQTTSPQILAAGLAHTAFHLYLQSKSTHTLSRQINFDIANMSLALTGLLCIISNSVLLAHSIPGITGTPMVFLAIGVHLVLSWSFQRNHSGPQLAAQKKQTVSSMLPPKQSCVQTTISEHSNLKLTLQGSVQEKDRDGKLFTCLEIPSTLKRVQTSLLNNYGQLSLPSSTYFAKGDMGSGKSTLAKRLLFQALNLETPSESQQSSSKFFGEGDGRITIQRPKTLINIFKPQEGDSTGVVKRPTMGNDLLTKLENYRAQYTERFASNPFGKQHSSVTELQKYFYLDLISNNELPMTFDYNSHHEIIKEYPKVQLLDLWESIHANMIDFIKGIRQTDDKVMRCLETQSLEHICNETESDGFSKITSGGNRCVFNAACIYAMLKIRLHNFTFSIFLDEPFNGSGACRGAILFKLTEAAREISTHSEPKPLLLVIAHEVSDRLASQIFEHSIEFDPVINNKNPQPSSGTTEKIKNTSLRSFHIRKTIGDLCSTDGTQLSTPIKSGLNQQF